MSTKFHNYTDQQLFEKVRELNAVDGKERDGDAVKHLMIELQLRGARKAVQNLMGGKNGSGPGLLAQFKSRGFNGAGTRSSISFADFKAAVWTGDIADLSVQREEGVPLGMDKRYLYPALPSEGVAETLTQVQVLYQSARDLADVEDMVRAIDDTSTKPETGSTRTLRNVDMEQVASVQTGVPNILYVQTGFQSIIEVDLRLAYEAALDAMVLSAIDAAGTPTQSPGSTTPDLIIAIRRAIEKVAAAGYQADTLVLTPAQAVALDTLRTSGPEAGFVPAPEFGLTRRVCKGAAEALVMDASAAGKLYASPVSLQSFEESAGATNSQTVRLESHAAFGIERPDAIVRLVDQSGS